MAYNLVSKLMSFFSLLFHHNNIGNTTKYLQISNYINANFILIITGNVIRGQEKK